MESAGRLAGALLAFALVAGGSLLAAAPGAASLSAQATHTVTTPPQRFFEVGASIPLVDNGQSQGFPEVQADRGGGIVVSYLEGFWSYYGTPTFMRFNASTGASVAGPFDIITATQWDMWSNTTARGAYSALDSQDRLIRVAWGISSPNSAVLLKGVDLNGSTTHAQKTVGQTPYARSAAAVAVAANDSVHVLHYDTAVRYSIMASNGTWLLRNATIDPGTATKFPPQLTYDAPAGRMIASWTNNSIGLGYVYSITPSGTVAWSRTVTMDGANLSVAATQDGGVLAVFADADALKAVKWDRDGAVAVAERTIVASAPNGRTPRPVPFGANEMLIVWSDATDGGDLDVRAMGVNATDLSVTILPTLVSNDNAPSVNPRAAVDRDGGVWVVWQSEISAFSASIAGTRIFPRWTGFSLEAPSASLTAVRGDVTRVPVRFTNLAPSWGQHNFTVSALPLGGPTNWTGWVDDGAGGTVDGVVLSPGDSFDLTLAIAPPVVDPAGYAAFIYLTATDRYRPEEPLSLVLNVTVVVGHRFEVGPSDQNIVSMAGQPASVSFQVKNNGTVPQVSLPLAVSAPPPGANWTASLSPATLTAAPGQWTVVTLTVTPPALARSGESYCARLRVQNVNDSFSLATAGFCVRVALVADPQVSPPSLSVTVDPGVAMPTTWTLTNVGNAGAGIVCSLAVQEFLPTGWSLTGSPAVSRLAGGASATLTIGITAPPDAPGGQRLDLTLRASCEGTTTFHDLPLTVTVRILHVVNYRTAGTTGDSNSTGGAVFTVSVENNGNVPEQVATNIEEAPVGWTATTQLTVAGVPVTEVGPFTTGVLRLEVQVPADAKAGSYRVVMSVGAGAQAPSAIEFTVRVPKTFGLSAEFEISQDAVPAGGSLYIITNVQHLGNDPDTYTVRVEVAASQFWESSLNYTPVEAGDTSALIGSSLMLDAFSEGSLRIKVTAPREPLDQASTIHVMITSTRGVAAEASFSVRVLVPELVTAFAEGQGLNSSTPKALGATTVRVIVVNAGTLAAAGFDVRLRLDGAPVGTQTVQILEAGATVELTFAFNLTAAAHGLEVEADPRDGANVSRVHGRIFEPDEANNLARATVIGGTPPPPPAPPKTLATTADASVGLLAALAAAGGLVALVVLRLKMRRKPQ